MTDKNTHADGLRDHDTDAEPVRLLVVDRQPAARRGLKMRLALEDLEVVGEACDAAEAIPLAQAVRPDVILMDVEIPGVSGDAAIEGLRATAPHSALVILTLREAAATQEQAREAGAAAFIAKHRREEVLLAAIRGVAGANAKHRPHERASASREEHKDAMRDHRGA